MKKMVSTIFTVIGAILLLLALFWLLAMFLTHRATMAEIKLNAANKAGKNLEIEAQLLALRMEMEGFISVNDACKIDQAYPQYEVQDFFQLADQARKLVNHG